MRNSQQDLLHNMASGVPAPTEHCCLFDLKRDMNSVSREQSERSPLTPLFVDSAGALWASFCFRFATVREVCASDTGGTERSVLVTREQRGLC